GFDEWTKRNLVIRHPFIEWPQQAVEYVSEQAGTQTHRQRAARPVHCIARAQPSRVLIDLADELVALETDHFTEPALRTHLDRLAQPEVALRDASVQHRATDPADDGFAHDVAPISSSSSAAIVVESASRPSGVASSTA